MPLKLNHPQGQPTHGSGASTHPNFVQELLAMVNIKHPDHAKGDKGWYNTQGHWVNNPNYGK